MIESGTGATSEDRGHGEGSAVGAGAVPSGDARSAGRTGRAWPAAAAGIVAGLIAFAAGEMAPRLVPAENVDVNFMGTMRKSVSRDTPGVISRTAAVSYGALGLCLAGGLGIAGGLSRRPVSAGAAAVGGLVGAALGAALGAGLAMGLVPPFLRMRAEWKDPSILIGLGLHLAAWAPLGIAAGLAFAVGAGDRRLIGRAVLAGLVGAVLGTLAFELAGAIAFPIARTDDVLAEDATARLLAQLLVCLCTALVVAQVRRPFARAEAP